MEFPQNSLKEFLFFSIINCVSDEIKWRICYNKMDIFILNVFSIDSDDNNNLCL